MKYIVSLLLVFLLLNSCATKKEILYLQDADAYDNTAIQYFSPTIQPNDILKITIGALSQEAIIPYNKASLTSNSGGSGGGGSQTLQLQGYLVTEAQTINFPQLGNISTKDKTTSQLEDAIKNLLEESDQLKNPTVDVRIMNAKVTVLGEVSSPGVYNFTEQNITLLQALGNAGDLTILGKREDILFIREVDGVRKVAHLDITSADIFDSPYYIIKPNDIIIVHPNGPKVKSAGYIGNLTTTFSVVTILLSTVILLTR